MRRFKELLERYGTTIHAHAYRYAPGVARMLDLNDSDFYHASLPPIVESRDHATAIAYPHPASVDPASAMAM